ncbi:MULTISPECIES: ATP-dependent zinc metalloprotease FtsH [unclassified Tolypothrix]|uniref:ATP-dependent zinc metalloprotease FtsH n=1 Tax=unclassified Tolypothrix TaxID=2649714 RepID=UPI0005EAC6C8|nr:MULTISPECIES: ATP-dependent zinc metalloprotease FtsH [unclassified Tolypothrix]BAY90405.1 FtsH peptidase [Microchaete diplosiphon NIES-3275]EKE98685.1 ATP-dependent metallopeptidase HflB [Tolypothrix sp. PCC 7601]MBE9086422.1 ATP-dependent zinc metalloprotease FtsH [Tolypothrix sp. LEGE 11397]UYD24579.1 ATP-dependent zinc metalloprotease FtsH [Tolypothrix sp. PCC 7712]UYD33192.1 ATP-dependent zinc metalloprotease FtsH [Tolypothrix sp. PCC 7601]
MPVENNNKNQLKPSRWRQFGGSFLILVTVLLLLNFIVPSFLGPRLPQVPYSDFVVQVEAGKVERAMVGSDRIEYVLKTQTPDGNPTEQVLTTTPVALDLDLPKILREHNVEFAAPTPDQNGWLNTLISWVAPPLIFFGIWGFLMNRQGGGPAALTVGKSKARISSDGSTGVKFTDVAGVDEAKVELEEIVDFLKNADKYTRLGAKIPKGALLVGPPGTGKTLLARAIAGEAGVPFFSISGSEFIELFVGVGAARVRDLFDQAKKQAPCIVFIDELDALGKSRAGNGGFVGGNDEREQTLNQLLTEMDGFDANTGVIIIAATNRPEVLDPALRRPGRFDRQIVVDRPDKIGREAILNVHARNVKLAEDVNLATIAIRTPGFAGADLANLVNEAALLAARQNRQAVIMADFNEAIERLVAGLEKRSRVLNETEKKTVAYHEVGHAIVGALMPGAGRVEKISVVPRGVGALGYTIQMPEEDRFLMVEDEIRGRIATLLGGRSAEEVVFGKVSTGASDDIQKATDMAERAITIYGMSDKLGPVAFEKIQQQFIEGYGNPRRSISPQVAEEIDREVKQTLDNAHHIALSILQHNRTLLEDTAQELLQQEILEGASLRERLQQAVAPEELNEWLRTGKISEDRPLLQTLLV